MKDHSGLYLKKWIKTASILLLIIHLNALFAAGQYREIYKSSNEVDVNGMSFLTPSTGFVAFSSYIGFTTDSGKTYIRREITYTNTDYNGNFINLTFGFYAQGVKAFSKDSLLAYGHFGTEPTILFSANQGVSWKVVYHRPIVIGAAIFNEGVTDMVFPGNTNAGFAVQDEELVATADRGQTWNTIISAPKSTLKKVSFPSVSIGYVIGGNKIFKTTDSGITWAALSLPGDMTQVYYNNVCFPSLNAGYIADYTAGAIYKTTNGGNSWTQINLYQAVKGRNMVFTNDSTGYITALNAYNVFKTTDSGKVWENCKRNTNHQYAYYGMQSLYFFNEKLGWAGGKREYIMITTDGANATLPVSLSGVDTTGYAATTFVKLVNHSKPNYKYQWLVNNKLVSTAYNASYTHFYFTYLDTVQLIVDNGIDKDTSINYQYFNVDSIPTILDFTPKIAAEGSTIAITGKYLGYTTSVSFGGVPASSFAVTSDSTLTAIVAKGASGAVTIASVHGGTSINGFIILQQPTAKAPVITSFNPGFGPIGTTVNIIGSNFNPAVSGNIVYFGATKAKISAASATKITCTVPFGATYSQPSILNTTTHLAAYSNQVFNVTFLDSSSNFTSHSFERVYPEPVETMSNYVLGSFSVNDFDGDGLVDIFSTQRYAYFGDSIIVYKNNSVQNKIAFDRRDLALGDVVAIKDIDGDGKADVISSGAIVAFDVYRNTSTLSQMSVSEPVHFPISSSNLKFSIEDFDLDGRPDIAFPGNNDTNVTVLKNTSVLGNVAFNSGTTFSSLHNQISALAADDFDGDGKKDILTLNSNIFSTSDFSIQFYKNTSTPNSLAFNAPLPFKATEDINLSNLHFIVTDVNNDGKPDVVISSYQNFYIFENKTVNGVFNLDPAYQVHAEYGADGAFLVSNLDGDGKPDLYAHVYGFDMNLTKNISTTDSINFEAQANLGSVVYDATSADFNNDGKSDILLFTFPTTPIIYVYQNNIGKPVTINSCTGGTAYLEADVAGTSYQWQQDNGTGFKNINDNSNFSGAAKNELHIANPLISWAGYRYRCIADNHLISSNFILAVQTQQKPIITVTASDTAICVNQDVEFVATAKNVNSDAMYYWYVNNRNVAAGPGQNTYSYNSFKNNDTLKVIVSTYDVCYNSLYDTSNLIIIKVVGETTNVQMTTSPDLSCAGTEITCTAVVTGALNPSYQWTVNGVKVGPNNPVFKTSTLKDRDVIQVKVTTAATNCSPAADVYSLQKYITIISSQKPGATIGTATPAICASASVLFFATTTNTNEASTYQWMVNGKIEATGTNTFTTAALQNNDQVKLIVTNHSACLQDSVAESNIITIAVTNVVAKAGNDQTICTGKSVNIGSDATSGYSYSWSSLPSGFSSSSSTPQVSPLITTKYYLVASNNTCTSSDTVTVFVSPTFNVSGLPPSPVATCLDDAPIAIGVVAQQGFNYSWQSSPQGFSSSVSNPMVAPKVSTTYTLTQTNIASGCQAQGQILVTPSSCITITRVTPNPASQYIIVETELSDLENTYFELFNSRGSTILAQKLNTSTKIIISGFASGIYKYIIRQNNTIKSKGQVVIVHR